MANRLDDALEILERLGNATDRRIFEQLQVQLKAVLDCDKRWKARRSGARKSDTALHGYAASQLTLILSWMDGCGYTVSFWSGAAMDAINK